MSIWGAAIGGGLSALGALSGRKAAKQQRRIAKEDRNVMGTAYEPINFSGIGGAGINFNTGGYGGGGGAGGQYYGTLGGKKSGQIQDLGGGYRRIGRYTIQSDINNAQLGLGELDPLRQMLMGAMPGVAASFGTQGTGQAMLDQVGDLAMGGGQGIQAGQDMIAGMSPFTGTAFGQAFGNLQDAQANPFQQDAMQGFLGSGQALIDRAGQGYDQAYNDTLGLLRESARPGEELAGANFLQRMFDTGGRSTSGGALQQQQFTQGLAQADTNRQLQALQEARNRQNQDLNVGQSIYGTGMDIRGMQDDLLGSATNRFGKLTELNQGLANDRFDMGQGQTDWAAQLGDIGMALRSSPYGAINDFMGAMGGLNDYAMTNANYGRNLMNDQARARLGQAGTGSQGLNAVNANNASMFASMGNWDWDNILGKAGSAFGRLGGIFGPRSGGGYSVTDRNPGAPSPL